MLMQQVQKEDCTSVNDAAKEVGLSRTGLYGYMNILNVQRYRFRFDRQTYILKSDVERIRKLLEEEHK